MQVSSKSSLPRLYGLPRSVYTRIARLALEEKAIPYRLEEVEIFGPGGVPPEHLGRHPFGRIPVFAHGGFQLYETLAICRYIDEAFSGPGLQPSSPALRARMMQVAGLLDAYAYRPMVWGVFVQRVRVPLRGGVPDEEVIRASLPAVEKSLDAIAAIQADAPFLAGDRLTLADLHAYPMLRYLSLAPEGASAIAARPSIAGWLRAFGERDSAARTRTEYE
jgi:glutathione S-transferase